MSRRLSFFPPNFHAPLRAKIEEYCLDHSISKCRFASLTNMSPSSLSHILSGKRPPTEAQLAAISKLFGTTSANLLNDLLTNFNFLPSAVLPQDIEHILISSELFMESLSPQEKVYCYLQCAHHINAFRALVDNGLSEEELLIMFPRFIN